MQNLLEEKELDSLIKNMENINYIEYDRITDTLMWLSDNLTLNFTVGLSRKSKSGERVFYHYESKYGSDKYGTPLRSIKRQMNFAFTIDCKEDFLAGIMLRPQDVELIVRLIEMKVLPWFLGDAKTNAYQVKDDKIILKEFEPVSYVQESKWISFEPAVYVDPYNEMETRGIKMELSTGPYCILPVDKFMGLLHILATTDMYAVACSMCNYVKSSPYGINTYTNQGLGASPNGRNSNVDQAWNNAKSKTTGFAKNSFLDNINGKENNS